MDDELGKQVRQSAEKTHKVLEECAHQVEHEYNAFLVRLAHRVDQLARQSLLAAQYQAQEAESLSGQLDRRSDALEMTLSTARQLQQEFRDFETLSQECDLLSRRLVDVERAMDRLKSTGRSSMR